jgi:uncharacterized protein with GYD domain
MIRATTRLVQGKEDSMPLYLGRFGYTPDSWAKMIENPEDRTEVTREAVESLGGKLLGLWYAFGESDGYWLGEMPDNASAAAVAIAAASSGALRLNQTTVLITVEEMLEALNKAKAAAYRAPGTS